MIKNHSEIREKLFESSIESHADGFLRPFKNPLARAFIVDIVYKSWNQIESYVFESFNLLSGLDIARNMA